jgi:tRNA (mo5U34)-methyltransferase
LADSAPVARLSDEELRREAAGMWWWHSIELRPGVVTEGRKTPEVLATEEEAILGNLRLEGRSVLDIGAWNGYFSLAAKRRGAARVLATDKFAWRSEWARGRPTIELAIRETGLAVETMELDPTEIGPEVGAFDVVLFLGVFYHLFDPIAVMQRLRGVTAGCLMVETHQDALDQERPMMVFYPGTTLHDDPTNWWGPNVALMRELLLELGYAEIWYRPHPLPEIAGPRGIYAAFLPGEAERLAATFGEPWQRLA